MVVVLLAAASSIHAIRWARDLSAAGVEVHLVSQHPLLEEVGSGVFVHITSFRGNAGYFTMIPWVKKILMEVKPDIVNAHYASGYGTTARLLDYHPWVLSVWGSDVYEFPHKSPLHKWLVKRNLRAADLVASTSYCMAEKVRTLAPELDDIAITPFGVDLVLFKGLRPEIPIQGPKLVIGTVKAMKPTYGIDTLIEAYALLLNSLNESQRPCTPDLELRLVGDGEQTQELQALASRLGVVDSVNFVGRVPHVEVPNELAKLDVYVALSRAESFGVAVIEAGAAGRPVVVSDAEGLSEVTVGGETGFIVPRDNPQAAAAALEKLVMDAELRHRFGAAGQQHVAHYYSWEACINTMIAVYNKTLDDI